MQGSVVSIWQVEKNVQRANGMLVFVFHLPIEQKKKILLCSLTIVPPKCLNLFEKETLVSLPWDITAWRPVCITKHCVENIPWLTSVTCSLGPSVLESESPWQRYRRNLFFGHNTEEIGVCFISALGRVSPLLFSNIPKHRDLEWYNQPQKPIFHIY